MRGGGEYRPDGLMEWKCKRARTVPPIGAAAARVALPAAVEQLPGRSSRRALPLGAAWEGMVTGDEWRHSLFTRRAHCEQNIRWNRQARTGVGQDEWIN